MQGYDPEKARRVWQRVQSGQEPPQLLQELGAMASERNSDALTYMTLSRYLTGKDSGTMRQLSQQTQTQAAVLRGICQMLSGARPVSQVTPPQESPLESRLRRCFIREKSCMEAFQKFTADAQFGFVFGDLSAQCRRQAAVLLEMLGRRPSGGKN